MLGRLGKPCTLVGLGILAATAQPGLAAPAAPQPEIGSRSVPVITVDGLKFRDLDRNGKLDVFEDWRRPAQERARDLIARMSIEEKAGQMMFAFVPNAGPPGQAATGYDRTVLAHLIHDRHVTTVSSSLSLDARALAETSNGVQDLAEQERFAIPAVIGTDPRHSFQKTMGASVDNGSFSQWPDPTGMGAIGSTALVRQFADIVRSDYRAVGFTVALSPQADLATEPRWPRINGTFGEDPATVAPLVAAYIAGAQRGDNGVAAGGISAVVKHWVGYGAARNGPDSHNFYGRFAALRTENLALHLRPFEAAFTVHPAEVMVTYSVMGDLMIDGRRAGDVGGAFSAPLVGDLLRGHYGYRGIVLSDWGVTQDCNALCHDGAPAGGHPDFSAISMAWGVENLDRPHRFAKAINAGVDQFGGDSDPAPILAAVHAGLVSTATLDDAVTRILENTFRLGLFENPFVSVQQAARTVGTAAQFAAGRRAQAQAMVVLQRGPRLPPITPRTRIYAPDMDKATLAAAGLTAAASPETADLAVFRLAAPYQTLHPGYFFGAHQHEGRLDFPADDAHLVQIRAVTKHIPVVVDVYLDRPAILTPLQPLASLLIADFGASDAALLDVLAGRVKPKGRLPFELPSSMQAVEAQQSDMPSDSRAPLYPVHFPSR
ncbi:glycoside hydrolase family 3 N-terminal domain-containing protein [Novosphingobium sp.]|uniref:glycoside hydrolase family 3 protein n=1 Tax=Novosphingobium sp. TaxID=1874826 RepID=UPI003D0BC22A